MTNPYRAMCAELVELSAPVDSVPQLAERLQKLSELAHRARALLAQPEPQPVAVSERLPRPEDCEAGECWGWDVAAEAWNRTHYAVCNHYTHWLPANALPIPITT